MRRERLKRAIEDLNPSSAQVSCMEMGLRLVAHFEVSGITHNEGIARSGSFPFIFSALFIHEGHITWRKCRIISEFCK